ncbi:MAG: penicillin-binding protein 1C, partial [Bacteroidales bacterium]|nr:penicillin-binding protein 1C [Bacteroidales bacterium]
MAPPLKGHRFLWQQPLHRQRQVGFWLIVAVVGIFFIRMLPDPLFQVPYTTAVYDRNGQLLGARIAADDQWRFPPGDSALNPKYVTALIRYEDKRFYRHCGIDFLALGRAVRQNIQRNRIISGASTLTMQTVRLARNRPRTFWEKGVEMLWAFRMELSYSKEEILQLYAAHAPFGGNVVGLEAASWRYFNHGTEELSWAEAALLAVLPNSPALIHPGKNNRLLKNKRDQLLTRLKEEHCLNEAEWQLALEEDLPTSLHALPQLAPHLVAHFHNTSPGQQIRSSIDADIQQQVEQAVERWSGKLAPALIRNMAVVVVSVRNSQVIAYCGNVPDDKQSGHVDIIRAPRSSGSILKPFLYATALQEGVILPHTLLPDVPVNLNGFSPHNFNYMYDGAVPADQALSRSLNVPMVLLLRQYGVAKFHSFLQSAGFTTLTRSPEDYGLSLILGGGEVTLWELAQAYTAMANAIIGGSQQTLRLSDAEPSERWQKPPFTQAAAW